LRTISLRNEEETTMGRPHAIDDGLDKLQDFLLAMAPGDEVSVIHARDISGLDAATCEAVLDALLRAGLMMRLQHDAYVRVRLEATERQAGKSPFNSV
jgi:predicted transcriptional regulator of viral defense system